MTLSLLRCLAILCCFFSAIYVSAQPGGGAGGGAQPSVSGQATSTSCTTTTCATNGSSNSKSLSLTYSTSTGIFTGTLTTNGCPNYARTYSGAASSFPGTTGSCITQTFPAPSFTSTPAAAPLLSNCGYTLNGLNVYGPFEAGFTVGQACTANAGSADAGVDVAAAEQKITFECLNAGGAVKQMFMDDCG